ncbi:MAG: RNA ligase family protein, partial [Mailhella sp.]
MQFIKYASIENLETARRIQSPAYVHAQGIRGWVVTEKIDGANIGLYFRRGEPMRIARRNALLKPGDYFYNVFAQVEKQLGAVKECFFDLLERSDNIEQIILHGEYFGRRVMNRINYGTDYDFRFFGMTTVYDKGVVNAAPFSMLQAIMSMAGLGVFVVPVLGYFGTFKEACAYPNDEGTNIFLNSGNPATMEGIVIYPRDESPVQNGKNLMFKNKNEAFVESTARTFHGEVISEEQKRISDLRERFKAYCTKNRMMSVFSKEGLPASKKDTGRYLAAFLEDAWQDFAK